jgi:ABC-type transport system substrate-binding protein
LRDEGFKLESFGLPVLGNIAFVGTFWTDNPIKDIRVRRAMSYAINRQEICDTFFKGLAKPGSRWFMDEHTWGWDPKWKADPYDPEKALALLKEAGYPKNFKNQKIILFSPPTNYTPDLMQILAGYWAEVGIRVDVKVIDDTELGGMIFATKDASSPAVGNMWPWIFGGAFNNVYHSANMFTSKGVHKTANDPKADELYFKAVNELDLVKAKKYWTEFMDYAYDVMFVNMGIMTIPNYWVVGPRIGKVTSGAHLSIWDAYAGVQHAE